MVGLPDEILESSPFRISGGQMRRVAIAGILAMEPDVLVLDEPTRGLDPKGAQEVMTIFNNMHKEYNKTIVLVSHDMDLISSYAERVIVLDEGRIIFDGPKKELFTHKDFPKFSLAKPKTYELMEYLAQKIKIPFKAIFNQEEILEYLKEIRNE